MVYTNLLVEYYEEPTSFDRLRENLDLLKERRVKAHLRAFTYKKIVARLYDYRGKLALNWKGPYRVTNTILYVLATIEGRQLLRIWYISNLMKFYI
ncbi:hypothetical protein BHM03_00044932 [Ensete ventricosum]|nr:hypothetical protein BHM03_00044932 [Ensete ventricosum]